MEVKRVKELMTLMDEHGFKRLIWKKDGEEITLEQKDNTVSVPAPLTVATPSAEVRRVEGTFITSPMVGTFYTSSAPQDPSFVKVGDPITADTLVCIIEAMKVMNEIKAGESGVVAEILINNGEPVEFGTKLFRIETS